MCRDKYRVLERFEVQVPDAQLDLLDSLDGEWAKFQVGPTVVLVLATAWLAWGPGSSHVSLSPSGSDCQAGQALLKPTPPTRAPARTKHCRQPTHVQVGIAEGTTRLERSKDVFKEKVKSMLEAFLRELASMQEDFVRMQPTSKDGVSSTTALAFVAKWQAAVASARTKVGRQATSPSCMHRHAIWCD